MWQAAIENDILLKKQAPDRRPDRSQTEKRYPPAKRHKEPDELDSVLGQTYTLGSKKDRQPARPTSLRGKERSLRGESPPRNEDEVRDLLSNMGFRILEKKQVGRFSGYLIEIVDHARAAEFGFKEWKQQRGSRGLTGEITCWMEPKGDGFLIWIDWRDVRIRDNSRLPPFVKLYAK